jgi:hypothetical protein
VLVHLHLNLQKHHNDMKKVFGLLFVAGLFAFASCNSAEETATETETTVEETTVEETTVDTTTAPVDTTATPVDTAAAAH